MDLHQVRIHMPFRHLHDRGLIQVTTRSFDDVGQTDVQYSDVVVLNHPTHPEYWPVLQKCKGRHRKPVIVDVDDLLTNIMTDHPDYHALKFVTFELPKVLHGADHLVVSTDYLAREYGHLNANVSVIENSVDSRLIESLRVQNKPYKKGFVVGWIGGGSHVNDQHYTFMKGLQEFTRRHDDVRLHFKFLCPQPFLDEFGVRCFYDEELVPYAEYHSYLSTVPWDVCLCGLYDHPFNHAKSDLRLLDVAPHEIPLIASPVNQFVRHRTMARDIMLYAEDTAGGDKGWLHTLEYAYNHRDETKAMAKRAKDYVYTERTSDQMADAWWDVLKRYQKKEDT